MVNLIQWRVAGQQRGGTTRELVVLACGQTYAARWAVAVVGGAGVILAELAMEEGRAITGRCGHAYPDVEL